jgi:hypothetical protein
MDELEVANSYKQQKVVRYGKNHYSH